MVLTILSSFVEHMPCSTVQCDRSASRRASSKSAINNTASSTNAMYCALGATRCRLSAMGGIYLCACVHVCMCACVYVCMCACVHACMCVCVYVCIATTPSTPSRCSSCSSKEPANPAIPSIKGNPSIHSIKCNPFPKKALSLTHSLTHLLSLSPPPFYETLLSLL